MMALLWCFVTLLLFEQSYGNLVDFSYKDTVRPNFYRKKCDEQKVCVLRSTLLGGVCHPEKYIPGGGVKNVEAIKAPHATVLKDVLSIVAGGSKTSSQVSAVMKAFGTTFKAASKMAPLLGGFSALFGFAGGFANAPDAMDAVNKAMNELTNQINNRLDSMSLYVEKSILESDRRWTVSKYKELFNKWADCMKKVTVEDVNECQRTAYHDIWAARSHFLKFKEKEGKSLTRDELKQVEVTLIAVRDYATLNLMVLKSLSDSYKAEKGDNAKLYYKHFLKLTQENSKHLADYTTWTFAEIMSFYNTQIKSSCKTSFECGTIQSTAFHSYSDCRCKMRPDVLDSQWCTNKVRVLVGHTKLNTDGYQWWNVAGTNLNSNTVQRYFSEKAIYALDEPYWKATSDVVRTYWQKNVMIVVPSWLEIGENAYIEAIRAECEWKTGEGVSGDDAWSEARFLLKDEVACVDKCIKLRVYENANFNGVSFANHACLCETKMTTTRNNDSRYKSCIFPALNGTRARRDVEDYNAEVEEYFKPLFQY